MSLESQFKLQKGMWLLAVGGFAVWVNLMAVFPVVPLLTKAFVVSPAHMGRILGLTSLIMIIINFPSGVISDTIGRRPFIVGSLAAIGISSFLVSISHSFVVFCLSWLIGGIGRGFYMSPAFAVLGDVFQPQNRGKATGYLTASIGAGSVFGYLLGGIVGGAFGWRELFVVLGIINIIAAVVSMFLMETSPKSKKRTISGYLFSSFSWLKYPQVNLPCIVTILGFTCAVTTTFLIPFAALTANISLVTVALFFIPYEVVGIVGTVVVARIADKVGRKIPLIFVIFFGGIGTLLLALFGSSFLPIIVFYSIVGFCEGTVIGTTGLMVTDFVAKKDPSQIGTALASYRGLYTLGAVLGPWLGGILYSNFSLKIDFMIVTAILLAAFFLAFFTKETLRVESVES